MVGSALFGQWWPTLHQGTTSAIAPLQEFLEMFSGTIGTSFLLITNPVGYSHQIMEGSYGVSPMAEKIGSYGVEVIDVKTSPVYVAQPYTVIVNVKNEGPVTAKNIRGFIPGSYRS
jgi:hypothetical protein